MKHPGGTDCLYLVVTVRNLVAGTVSEEWFSQSPVTVGRREDSELRLDGHSVSSRHGAFLFAPDSRLQYIDFNSTNGSVVGGVWVDPNMAVTLRDRSVVGICPFLLIVRTELASPRDSADDVEHRRPITASTPDPASARFTRSALVSQVRPVALGHRLEPQPGRHSSSFARPGRGKSSTLP
jgi:pSer/pThr/pTyr-binding forkhead associated (FHA) protein